MGYLVVTGYDSKNKLCNTVCINDEFDTVYPFGWFDFNALVEKTLLSGYTPINFSVDRNKQLKMDCGDFNRFSKSGSAVILAEIKTAGGKTIGYKLLSCVNNIITNLKVDDILNREASYGKDNHFLQNGIIRNDTVNCYPLKPFPVITVNQPKKKKNYHITPVSDSPKDKKRQNVTASDFTPSQLAELDKCKKNGVNPRLIYNPNFTPEQMRVLWVSKSKGAISEAFANPKLSTEVMKFYADRLYDKSSVTDCSEMLKHPDLNVDELSELYACVCDGIPYEGFIGKSATDINVERTKATIDYWGSQSRFDPDYYEKALNVAMKEKGFK